MFDEHRSPPVKKRGQWAVRFPQEHIHASRAWEHPSHFGIGQAAGDRKQPAQHPGEQQQRRGRNHSRHPARREEDARADDVTNDKKDR